MSQARRTVIRVGRWLERHPLVLPAVILIAGGFFRFFNLNWDSGLQLHPDERFIYEVVSGTNNNPPISWPSSLHSLFQVSDPSGGSPLNPHFFQYGSLPFYLLALLAGAVSFIGRHFGFLSSWAQADTYAYLPGLGRGLSATLDLISVFVVFLIGRRVFGYWTGVLSMAFAAFTVLDIQLAHFYAVDTVLLPFVLLTLLAAVKIARPDPDERNGNGLASLRWAYVWGGIALGAALATKTTALLLVVPFGAAALLGASSRVPWSLTAPGSQARWTSFGSRIWNHYRQVAPELNRNLLWLLGSLFIAALTFVFLEPYAVLDRSKLVADLAQQTQIIVTNNPPFGVPYTIQYAHTTPYVYQLANLLFWSLGVPLGLTAFAGTAYFVARALLGRISSDQLVLLIWVVPYFLFVGSFFAKFNRYMLPIVPILTLLGAALLVSLARAVASVQLGPVLRRLRLTPALVLAAVLAGSFGYSLAYLNIYEHTNTRVAASEWIFAHIPSGTTIANEGAWDDPLPMDINGHSGSVYHYLALDLYDGEMSTSDEQSKIAKITKVLTHARYIVMSSERMIGSIPKLPYAYPLANRYYQLLFSNHLNFRLVRQFQQHPQLGPIVVHDYSADESFHVYDHPNVRIFQRIGPISTAQAHHLLTTGLVRPPRSIDPSTLPVILRPREPTPDTRLMLTPKQWAADQKGQSFAEMFPKGGFGMQYPILAWWMALEILGIIAFPLAFVLFRNLLDRGFVIAKTIGLVTLGYLVWIAVSAGIATYERGLIFLALLLLALGSAVSGWRRRFDIASFFRERWRYVTAGEIVFLAGFGMFVLLRMWYPDLGHQFSPPAPNNIGSGRMGEKQMELAYLNAIVRSRVFPPLDPFFAHGYINYYYYGFFLVGTLCKLTQIIPATGFNLAIASFFALLVGGIFSVALSLTKRVFPAVLGALFVGAIGNFNAAWQVIRGLMSIATVHSSFPFTGGIINVISGLQRVVFAHQSLPPFDYWEPTRIVPGSGISEFPYFTYLFADLHPHLMAYPLVAAGLALAVSLLMGKYRPGEAMIALITGSVLLGAIAATNPWDFPTYLIVIAFAALIGGYSIGRNLGASLGRALLWPAALALLAFVLYLPFKQSYQTVFSTGIGLVRNTTSQMLQADGVCQNQAGSCATIVHEILVTPLRIYLEHFGFFLFIIASYLAVLIWLDLGVGSSFRRTVTWVQFAIYYRDRLPRVRHAGRVANRLLTKRSRPDLTAFLALLILVAGLSLLGYYLLAFLVAFLGLTAVVLAYGISRLSPAQTFVLALLGFGALISAGTQIFFVKDFLAEGSAFRMNTIFKFYDQVWILFAIGSACVLSFTYERLRESAVMRFSLVKPRTPGPRLVGAGALLVASPVPAVPREGFVQARFAAAQPDSASALRGSPAHQESPQADRRRHSLLAFVPRYPIWSACVALLFGASLIYTYAGTVARESARADWLPAKSVPYTLDGMAFMKVAYPGDYSAIQWLNAHVTGAPVIAEAPNGYYDWRSRVSMFTGLPSIFNGIHEDEQRYGDEIDPSALCAGARDPATCQTVTHSRQDDAVALYNSSSVSTAWQIIRRYGVEYIYVGWVEKSCIPDPNAHQCFSRAGLKKLDRMVGHGLRIAYRRLGVTIYKVTSV